MLKHPNTLAPALALVLSAGGLFAPAASATGCFIGEVRFFAGNFAPRSWALAHGQLLSISQNTALFSILGTTYGGDGRTTFGLPDLRGRAPIGAGQGPGLSNYRLGDKRGAESATLTQAEMPNHGHNATTTMDSLSVTTHASDTAGDSASPAGNVWAQTGRSNNYQSGAPDATMRSDAVTVSGTATTTISKTGGNQPLSLMQPVQALTPIICIQGIFPSRN